MLDFFLDRLERFGLEIGEMRTRQGQLSVKRKVVTERGKKYTVWRIDGYDLEGKRIRFRSQDEKEAKLKLVELQTRQHNQQVDNPIRLINTRLSDTQIHDAELAVKLLDGRSSILEAVKKALEGNGMATLPRMAISSAVEQFLHERKTRVRGRTLREYERELGQFERFANGVTLAEITIETVLGYMASLRTRDRLYPARPKTRNNAKANLHAFFAWCVDKGWIASNPAEKATRAKIDMGLREVLSVRECRGLMDYARGVRDGECVRFFALCLFAGLRPAEVERLEPKAIDLDNNVVRVSAAASKTHKPRHVTIQPNLREWLVQYPKGTTTDQSHGNILAIRRECGLANTKGRDVLRHTFISNHVMAFGSFAETSIEAGNSESIIKAHYFNAVSKTEALKFWEIRP